MNIKSISPLFILCQKRLQLARGRSILLWVMLIAGLSASIVRAANTLTVQASSPGPTPDIMGYNLAHFYTGGNTPMWLRYSGVNGARIFISPAALGEYVNADDIAPWGDGVTDQASFVTRKGLLRNSQLTVGTSGTGPYINWTYFTALYTHNIANSSTSNQIVPVEALSQLRALNIEILVNITASPGSFPIASASDWAGKWELWQHFYAQAYYLAKNYDVKRYQIYNEPDAAANGLPGNANFTDISDYLMRLKLASDAIQSAVTDVNAKYGKTLVPEVLSPVTTHGDSDYFGSGAGQDWGHNVVNSRHTNFLEQTSSNYQLINQYDFHKYGNTPSAYESTITTLEGYIATDMPGETPFTVSVSEFNTHSGADFDTLTTTLDSPTEYSTFGAISTRLLKSTPGELYCFKFGQTLRTGTSESDPAGTVQKNGMHYVDNWNSPYNVGGSTKAGEVWRLVNKGFSAGRTLRNYTRSNSALSPMDFNASYDPVLKRYYLLSVNATSSYIPLIFNTSAWNLPVGNRFVLEEVSESSLGATRSWGSVGTGNILLDGSGGNSFTQPANTVWLFTLPTETQAAEQTVVVSDDAMVKDGSSANSNGNFGTSTDLQVCNTTASTPNGRSAAFLKFHLPAGILVSDIQLAVLSVTGSYAPAKTSGMANVYGLPNTSSSWTETSVTWNNGPNLNNSAPGGSSISNNFVQGGNAALTSGSAAMMCGQILTTSAIPTEYLVDVTSFLRAQTINDHDASFLIAREVRFYDDAINSDGIALVSKEASATTSARLRLILKNNSSLSALSSTAGALTPLFTSGTLAYSAIAANSIASTTVTPTSTDPASAIQVRINGGAYASVTSGTASATLPLNVGANTINIKVTAQDGITSTTYALTASRAANTDVNLSALASTAGPLTPAFSSGITAYNATAAIGMTFATVTPTAADAAATLQARVNGGSYSTVASGTASAVLPLAGGDNTIDIRVTAQDGLTTKTYTLIATVPASQLTVTTEATVNSGAPSSDVDEAASGYMMVKYDSALNSARKSYFQFDLGTLDVNPNAPATFTLNFTNNYAQRVQLWGLNQGYPGFTTTATWNGAQANNTASNTLLTSAPLTATAVGATVLISPGAGLTPYSFTVPRIGDFLIGGRVTLALSGASDASNNNSGLRLLRNSAALRYSLNNPPTLSAVANQTAAENTAISGLAFTVGDAETAVGSLTVSGSSSNITLVPNANIVFSGSGANRTVSVVPAANQSGSSTITLSVSDGTTATSTSFLLTVTADPPLTNWKQANFGVNCNNPAVSGDLVDYDQDGLSNLLEYALGSDPNSNTAPSALPQASVIANSLALTFTRTLANTDITMTVQAVDKLTDSWSDLASSINGAATSALISGVSVTESGTGATRSVQVRDPYTTGDPAHPRRFMRVKVAH